MYTVLEKRSMTVVNVFEHDAIPTWSGFVYQGRIAVYLAIKEIIEQRNDNKMSEIDRYR